MLRSRMDRSRNTACSGSRSTPPREAERRADPRLMRAARVGWERGVGLFDIFGFGPGGWGLALLEGAGMTLLVSATGLLVGAVLGALVAWGRLSGALFAGAIGQAYAALFRGLPELLIVYFVYFGTSTLLTSVAHGFGS